LQARVFQVVTSRAIPDDPAFAPGPSKSPLSKAGQERHLQPASLEPAATHSSGNRPDLAPKSPSAGGSADSAADDFSRVPSLSQVYTDQYIITASVVQASTGPGEMPTLGTAGYATESRGQAEATSQSASSRFGRTLSDSNQTSSYRALSVPEVQCQFIARQGPVWVIPAPVKGMARMKEKVAEYNAEGAPWPRAGSILDPVRATVVCQGPADMLEVARWFLSEEGREGRPGLPVCRIKNKFAHDKEELVSACPPCARAKLARVAPLYWSAFCPCVRGGLPFVTVRGVAGLPGHLWK
jgi:hypothetical protein